MPAIGFNGKRDAFYERYLLSDRISEKLVPYPEGKKNREAACTVQNRVGNLAGGVLGLVLFEVLAAVRKVIRPEVKNSFLKYIYGQCKEK